MSLKPHSYGAVVVATMAILVGCRKQAATNADKAFPAAAATMYEKYDDWPFSDSKDLAVITVDRIVDGRRPILFVSHDVDDGGWQFLDGNGVTENDARVVSLQALVERDPTLRELADLPLGWKAERDAVGKPWRRSQSE